MSAIKYVSGKFLPLTDIVANRSVIKAGKKLPDSSRIRDAYLEKL